MKIDIYRGDNIIASPNIDNQTVFSEQLMGEHKITAVLKTPAPLALQVNDYIIWKDVRYSINQNIFEAEKDSELNFVYTIDFEAPVYNLTKKKYKSSLNEKTFSYFGAPLQYLELLLTNIAQIDDGWTIGDVDDATPQTINFDSVDCRQALTQIAQAFNLEYHVQNKVINLKQQVGNDTALSLSYGQGNGLYKITRKALDDSKLVTRLWGYGGSQNIDGTYRDGATQLQFTGGYLEKNTDLYGIIEDDYVNEDIFPQRTGTVSAIDAGNALVIYDGSLDFNINDQLLPGVTAQIVFKTGTLAGCTFDIAAYDSDTKKITFNASTEDNSYTLPNDTRKPTVGDQYTIVQIKMPDTYITDAETDLQTETQNYLDKYSQILAAYDVQLSRLYIRRNNYTIFCADRLHVADSDLYIDATIRATQVSYPLIDEFAITLTISDDVLYDVQTAQVKKVAELKRATQLLTRTSAQTARQNAQKLSSLKQYMFDSDGKLNTDVLAVGSIDTRYLNVGAVSENFALSGVVLSCNVGGNANVLDVSAGALIHNVIQIEGVGYTWEMASKEFTGLASANAYYLYARCSQTELVGTWELSTDKKTVDAESGYYWFLIGVLYAVGTNSTRDADFAYGVTTIVGDRLTVGTIQSLNGNVIIGLTDGTIKIGDQSRGGMDFNVTTANTATFYGGLVQRAPGITAPMAVWRGEWSDAAPYFTGDQVTSGGSSYTYIYPTSTSGNPVSNTTYWKPSAIKGDTGDKGDKGDTGDTGDKGDKGDTGDQGNFVEYRFAKNGSPTVAPTITNTDAIPAGWTITQPAAGLQEYIWITSATKTAAGALVTNWSDPSRLTGQQGDYGPVLSFLGEYDNVKDYYGLPQGVVAVTYGGSYYVSRVDAGTFSGVAPTDTSKWNPFPVQVEAIATGLLLAQESYIENLTVGKISTSADNSHPYLKAAGGEIDFWDAGTTDESDKGKALIRMGNAVCEMVQDSGGSPVATPGIAVRDVNKSIDGSHAYYSEVSSGGLFTNASSVNALALGYPANFSIAGLLQRRNSNSGGLSAAIFGNDQTDSSYGSSQSYGGWFNSLFAGGLHIGVTRITGNYTANLNDCYISCENTGGDITVTLPAVTTSTYIGKVFLIFREASHGVTVAGNGNTLVWGTTSASSQGIGGTGALLLAVWTGRYWQTNTL